MRSKKTKAAVFVILLLTIVAAIEGCGWFGEKTSKKFPDEPVLYLIKAGEMVEASPDILSNSTASNDPNLVIITHGWIEMKAWPEQMAEAIRTKTAKDNYFFGWYDWRTQAKKINPIQVTQIAKDAMGQMLAEKILAISKDWNHIHLIGHSAGSWVISEAAKILADKTNAEIHLTFLDAYVPPTWDEAELGKIDKKKCWADHYFTKDLTLGATEKILSNAHNLDLTAIDPGIKDHEFPHYWYYATITGHFAENQRYEGAKMFNTAGAIEYGFARSKEAGEKNWQQSQTLRRGNDAIKIKTNQPPLQERVKEFLENSLNNH